MFLGVPQGERRRFTSFHLSMWVATTLLSYLLELGQPGWRHSGFSSLLLVASCLAVPQSWKRPLPLYIQLVFGPGLLHLRMGSRGISGWVEGKLSKRLIRG